MNLKSLMTDGIDVTDLYTKSGELLALLNKANDIETLILHKEGDIRELLKNIPRDESGRLTIDLMNGSSLIINEYTVLLESNK